VASPCAKAHAGGAATYSRRRPCQDDLDEAHRQPDRSDQPGRITSARGNRAGRSSREVARPEDRWHCLLLSIVGALHPNLREAGPAERARAGTVPATTLEAATATAMATPGITTGPGAMRHTSVSGTTCMESWPDPMPGSSVPLQQVRPSRGVDPCAKQYVADPGAHVIRAGPPIGGPGPNLESRPTRIARRPLISRSHHGPGSTPANGRTPACSALVTRQEVVRRPGSGT
jgi:hypothetical protein